MMREMKSIVIRLALVLAMFTIVPNALAADTDTGNFFLDAKFGQMSETSDWGDGGSFTQTHSSWGAGGGYLWRLNTGGSLGFELGYMHFGDVSYGIDANEFTTETTSATAMTAGLHYEYLFGDDEAWVFQGRLGLMRAELDETYIFGMGPPFTGSNSSHEGGVYVGAGLGRHITQSFSLTLAYTMYYASGSSIDLSPTWLGLEAEYRF